MEQVGVQLVAQGASAFGADMASATKAVAGFGASVDTSASLIQDAAGRWRTSSGRFATDAQKAAAGVETVTPAAKDAGDAVKKAGDDAEQGGKGFSAWGEMVKGALREVGKIAVDALGQAAKATVSFVKDSIGVAGDFQQEFAQFQIAVGHTLDGSGKSLNDFKQLFISLGKELPVSTGEVEQAAVEMARGGIDPAVIAAGGLRQTIQFASAALKGDLVSAAQISAKTMQAWTSITDSAATKTDFLTHAQNLMTQATTAASTTVDQLFLGLSNVGGTARLAGVSFDETVKALAQLTPSFASSADAGTSFKTFLQRLQPTTKPAIAAFQELNLLTQDGTSKFYDAQGSFIGMAKAEGLLQDAMKGLTKAQIESKLQTIFGADAINAASVFVQQGTAGYDALSASIAKQTTLTDAAKINQDTYNTAVENAKGSVEALQITVGSALLPVLTDLMNNVIAPSVNTITTMADAIGGSDDAFNSLAPRAQAVVTVIDVLVADVQEIIGAFNDAGAGTTEFANRIGDLASDLGLPGALISGLIQGTQGLVASFQDGSAAASDLGGVVTDLTGVWNTALTTATDVGNGYLAIAQAILPQVTTFWTNHGTEISTFAKTTYDTVIRVVTGALQLYDAVVPPALQSVANFFTQHGTAIQSILTGVYHVLEGIVTGGLALIEGAINVSLDLISGDYTKAWGDIKMMSATFVSSLITVITGGLEIIAGAFDTNLTDIANTWQHNMDALVEIAMKIGARMVVAGESMIEGIIKGVEDESGALYHALEDMASNAFNAFMKKIQGGSPAMVFVPAGQSVVQGVVLGMQNTIPALTGMVEQMDSAMLASFAVVNDDVRSQVSKITDGILAQIKSAQDAIGKLKIAGFGSTADIDRQKLSNIDNLNSYTGRNQTQTQAQLEDAEREAAAINDPKQAAEYFQMRSKQIIELADLQQKLQNDLVGSQRAQLDATVAQYQKDIKDLQAQPQTDDRDAQIAHWQDQLATAQSAIQGDLTEAQHVQLLNQQMILESAQEAERQQFKSQAAQGSDTSDLVTTLQSVLGASNTLNGKDFSLPGLLDNPIMGSIYGLINQLTTPIAPQYIGGTPASNNYTSNKTVNMPIYTNQSPSVLQSSAAMIGASL